MGNCCDFLEQDVRDKIHGQQQGTLVTKSSKRIHNVFRDKSKKKNYQIIRNKIDEVQFRIERHDEPKSLSQAVQLEA